MKVALVFPPSWTPTMPHLALPTLAGCLRENGIEVELLDLNLEFLEAILCPQGLSAAADMLQERRALPQFLREQVVAEGEALSAKISRAKAVVCGEAFFTVEEGLAALNLILQALAFVSSAYEGVYLELSGYVPALPLESSAALRAQLADGRRNPFLAVSRERFVPRLLRLGPDLVGISVVCLCQLLPALTLARLLRQAGYEGHITLGGPHVTMLREELPQLDWLWELVDSLVIGEGEEPLLRLVEALAGRGSLGAVPGLVRRANGRVAISPLSAPARRWPMPDFRGLPLRQYLVPRLVLPIAGSRGCYHGRCAFCNVGYGLAAPYRALPPEEIAAQMQELARRHGTRYFFFADEVISPQLLEGLARELRGGPFSWVGCARLEPALTEGLLRALAEAGCRMLLFGLESGCARTLRRMRKGIELSVASRILRQSAAAGIWNHIFFFFGFPGEGLAEAQETVNFLYEHADCIHSAAFGSFLLERHAPAHRDPARFGIRKMWAEDSCDLAISLRYEAEHGLTEKDAGELAERFLGALPDRPAGHLYLHDTYRFLYACSLQEQGLPYPLWLQ